CCQVVGEESSRIEELPFFKNQLNDAVIVLGSEAVAMGRDELATSYFGLLTGQIEPEYLAPDFGYTRVQVASSDDGAKLVRHRPILSEGSAKTGAANEVSQRGQGRGYWARRVSRESVPAPARGPGCR